LEKGIEKQGLQLRYCPLIVFKASVILFSLNTLHHAYQNHFPNSFTLRTTKLPYPTSEEVSHPVRHDPCYLK
jgi:hypothetical protein